MLSYKHKVFQSPIVICLKELIENTRCNTAGRNGQIYAITLDVCQLETVVKLTTKLQSTYYVLDIGPGALLRNI